MQQATQGTLASTVTRRGLEITVQTPNVIVGCLVPLMMLLGFVALVLSAAAELLRRLELHPPPDRLPVADSTAAIELMIRRAERALARMSDAELVGFVREYDQADWYARADGLHGSVLEPALCGLLAAPRPAEVRTALSRLVYGTPERRRELCSRRATGASTRRG